MEMLIQSDFCDGSIVTNQFGTIDKKAHSQPPFLELKKASAFRTNHTGAKFTILQEPTVDDCEGKNSIT
ncbi:hypothetical protein SNOG_11244 [Parastagonospora nodorum SN15]|uniref:Uncharacterized protein n=1 Tax=Phaeosphaeria nodorum (strain SN15 / ATCC MYA-4574 / FGSC 10173) TaxID=321614 RepID=Q0UAH0_PHANO|nr:hypothetical protein SNOG_11244 [Parastagonospora nodorum SN15]EAT81743.1 hypothetical protein SNOG_11244 [Parastagonospora nodorum SN15]